jgi:hypothetical protein
MTNDGMKYGVHGGRVASGLIILALGALMLLDRHDVFGLNTVRFFPGVVLILMGAVRLIWGDAPRRRHRAGVGGIWLVFIGTWLIANQTHWYGLRFRNSWPILIVAWGVTIVARELFGSRDDTPAPDVAAPSERR